MVYFEKSQPAPECLETEKAKANGDYKCSNVLEKIKIDFKNKCYICEYKEPTTINVEHFKPHKGNKDLKFDWNNLFWACSHCNNTKLDNFEDILNCTDKTHDVENKLKYLFEPFPHENVRIIALDNDAQTIQTRDLLNSIYNGTTKLKTIESANLRDKLLDEIMLFQQHLRDYFKESPTDEIKQYYLIKIRSHLNRASNFTAFKRWIVLKNEKLRAEFEQYFNE